MCEFARCLAGPFSLQPLESQQSVGDVIVAKVGEGQQAKQDDERRGERFLDFDLKLVCRLALLCAQEQGQGGEQQGNGEPD